MGYTKKTLQELDLIDNFLSNAIASNQEINEQFYQLLLQILVERYTHSEISGIVIPT